MGGAAGIVASLLAGGVWGVAFWSWGLPLPIPLRVVGTLVLVAVMAAASREGMAAASAFLLGMGATSGILLAAGGHLFIDWWGLVPASALGMGAGLAAAVLLREPTENAPG